MDLHSNQRRYIPWALIPTPFPHFKVSIRIALLNNIHYNFLSGSFTLGSFQFEISGEIESIAVGKVTASDSVITSTDNKVNCNINHIYVYQTTFVVRPRYIGGMILLKYLMKKTQLILFSFLFKKDINKIIPLPGAI